MFSVLLNEFLFFFLFFSVTLSCFQPCVTFLLFQYWNNARKYKPLLDSQGRLGSCIPQVLTQHWDSTGGRGRGRGGRRGRRRGTPEDPPSNGKKAHYVAGHGVPRSLQQLSAFYRHQLLSLVASFVFAPILRPRLMQHGSISEKLATPPPRRRHVSWLEADAAQCGSARR